MKTLGLIGLGNMGGAICRGLLAGGALKAGDVWAFDANVEKPKQFQSELGIHACASVGELLSQTDVILMAVKPNVVERVLAEQRESLKGKALLSIVAGYDLQRYRPLVDGSVRVQYIMPNVPCAVGEGVFLFEQDNTLADDERTIAESWFSAAGTVVRLPGGLMNAGMAVSGCGPAFFAMAIEAVADAGVKYGLPRDVAYRLAAQTAAGTGKMQLQTGMIPAAIKDAVCSPGGVTIRGCEALEKGGLRSACYAAVQAVMDKK